MQLGNKEIFSSNLKHYMNENGLTRKELCGKLGYNYNTFSDWYHGRVYPKMDIIQELADYFDINKSDMVEERSEKNSYYLDSEVARMAQDLHDNPEHRALFKASRKLSKEDMETVKALIDRLTNNWQ